MADQIFIALGTNIGSRESNLNNALSALEKENIFHIQTTSHIYETEPWGYLEQDSFLNMVIQGSSLYPPTELLEKLKSLEVQLGRSPTFHYGPRLIDLDILFYGNQVVETPILKIPHPEMQNRDFVLYPLCEIAPNFIHPEFQQPVTDMLKALPKSNIKLKDYLEINSALLREKLLNPPFLKETVTRQNKVNNEI